MDRPEGERESCKNSFGMVRIQWHQTYTSKCYLLVCGHKFQSMVAKIVIDNAVKTQEVKLLGMSIDSKLTFDKHMDTICKTAPKKLNAREEVLFYLFIDAKC